MCLGLGTLSEIFHIGLGNTYMCLGLATLSEIIHIGLDNTYMCLGLATLSKIIHSGLRQYIHVPRPRYTLRNNSYRPVLYAYAYN